MSTPFTSTPSRSCMLCKFSDLTKYLDAHPDLKAHVRVISQDSIGFVADVGAKTKAERFDFSFNGEAFYEILAQANESVSA